MLSCIDSNASKTIQFFCPSAKRSNGVRPAKRADFAKRGLTRLSVTLEAIKMAQEGPGAGFVPGCAGTCAGSLARKLLMINSVPVCRVKTPTGVGSVGGSVRRHGKEAAFAAAGCAHLASS